MKMTSEVEVLHRAMDSIEKNVVARVMKQEDRLEQLGLSSREFSDRILALEQKRGALAGSNLGAPPEGGMLVKSLTGSAEFRAFLEKRMPSAGVPVNVNELLTKNTITGSGSNVFAAADRLPGIVATTPERRIFVADLLPRFTSTAGSVEYTRESTEINAAGAQASEGAAKPESTMTFSLVSLPHATVAHFLKTSRQVLSDSAALQEFLRTRLTYCLRLELDDQVLNGDALTGNMSGMLKTGNFVAYAGGQAGDTKLDALRRAIGQLQTNDYVPDAIVVHPTDWTAIELIKETSGAYIVGAPAGTGPNQLWSIPVAASSAIPLGTFMVAALAQSVQLHIREDAQVMLSDSDTDNFTKNLVTVLAEMRASVSVMRPAGIIKGTLP
jgi:HK97 family phage major capsid protein